MADVLGPGLARYLRTGDARDLPPVPPATWPPAAGPDAAATARLALVRWHRYRHLPGVAGLPEYRAASHLAATLDAVPSGVPPLPEPLAARVGRTAARGRRARRRARRPGAEEEAVTLGAALTDQLLFLAARFEDARDSSALDTLLALQERLLRADGTSPRERAALFTDRARVLLTVGELGAHRSHPAEAERCAAEAVRLTAQRVVPDDPHLAGRLLLKGRCAAFLYDPDADPSGLERAVDDLRRAAEAAARTAPAHLDPLRELAATLVRWYENGGPPTALADAVAAARDLDRATDHADRRAAEHRKRFADLLERARTELGDATVDARLDGGLPPYVRPGGERAQAWWRTAADLCADPAERLSAALALVGTVPPGDEDRTAALVLAAEAEVMVCGNGGPDASLKRARARALLAADAAPPGHRLAGRALAALARATLWLAANGSEELDDVLAHETVGLVRQAAAALRPGEPDTPARLDDLASLLFDTANVLADRSLLPETLALQRRALDLTPADAPFRPFRLSTLAGLLEEAAVELDEPAWADEAVAVAREAADSLPADHPNKHELLFNLASTLLYRMSQVDRAAEGLDEAERLYRTGRAMLPPGHPDHARFISSLSQVLHVRYEETGDRGGLAEAVDLAREAVRLTPPDDPFRTERRMLLARPCTVLHDLAQEEGGEAAALRAEALAAWEAVAADENLPIGRRIEVQHQRARLALAGDDPHLALRALEDVLARMPRIARRWLTGPVRKDAARRAPHLAAQAAVAAIRCGRPGYAVELLERGRAVLYSEAMAGRRLRTLLESVDPAAAKRLARIDAALSGADFFANVTAVEVRSRERRAFGRVVTTHEKAWDPRPQVAARTRRLAAERAAVLEEFATTPEFEEATRQLAFDELRSRLAGRPVVHVLAHPDGGHALLVPADPRQDVVHIPLPGLTTEAVERHAARTERAVRDATDVRLAHHLRAAAQTELHTVLEWLWDEVASPVLARLPGTDRADAGRPRLWWCPVGPVVRLPLHAAGRHTRPRPPGSPEPPPTVMDRVVSSYTPTLAALARALRDGPDRPSGAGHPGALVVAVQEARGLPPLPQARREAEAVLAAVPGARLLMDEEATVAAVEEALGEHTVVHFACHGDNDASLAILRGGGLHLASGETLPATRIQESPLDHGALAFLSACSTAEPHPGLPDEPMHLAAAFQLAGFRSVIGTLWRAPDTPGMAAEVYAALTARGTRPPDPTVSAAALNAAVRAVRDAYPAAPTRWAAHLHTGA
ncbi:CHAT domain-containing protein [Streptomyces sp. enrichment culture]|uniref:CHAT domain-containing protein n=1 Tax=Streptomyces sp. enrichment culture TaxID=1795815 RepID=UPI003F54B448